MCLFVSIFLLRPSHLIFCDKSHASFLCKIQRWMTERERSSKQKIETKKHFFMVKLQNLSFSLNDLSVSWKIFSVVMMCVKYNFVKPFSPHVESVNDKKRDALVPTVSLPLTTSLSVSIINQSCDRLFLISRCSLVSSLHTHELNNLSVFWKIFSIVIMCVSWSSFKCAV